MSNKQYKESQLKPALCEKDEYFRMQECDFWESQRRYDQQEYERFNN